MASCLSFANDLGVDVLTLYVGPAKEQFVIHKNLLVTRSTYFKGALATGLFKESQDGVFTFEEEDPDAFRLLIAWLYQGGRIPRVPQYLPRPDFSKYRPSASSPSMAAPPSTRASASLFRGVTMPDPHDPSKEVVALNITTSELLKDFSVEEIRLADYENAEHNVDDPLRRDAGPAMEKPECLRNHDEKRLHRKPTSSSRQNWIHRKPVSMSAVAESDRQSYTLVPLSQSSFTFHIDNPIQDSTTKDITAVNPTQDCTFPGNSSQGTDNATPEKWASLVTIPEEGPASSEEEDHFEDAVDTPFPPSRGSDDRSTASWTGWGSDDNSLSVLADYAGFVKEAEKHQLTLLRLVILAEKLCWDNLFNASMDAFLDGEEQVMSRNHVPLEFIEMAYSQCHGSSPVRQLFADLVHFEVKTCLTHSRYLSLAGDYEDFLTDLFKRLDHKAWIPGKGPYSAMRNPLKARRCIYHIHEAWAGCCPW